MDWLLQNWIWIAVAAGGVYLMTRMHGMHGMGGCGGGHRAGHSHGNSNDVPPVNQEPGPGAALDAVTGHAVTSGGTAPSTIFRGRAYYFESRENRDAFETDPDKYLAASPGAGQVIGAAGASGDGPRRRHGC